jgi:hypothetical protein
MTVFAIGEAAKIWSAGSETSELVTALGSMTSFFTPAMQWGQQSLIDQ